MMAVVALLGAACSAATEADVAADTTSTTTAPPITASPTTAPTTTTTAPPPTTTTTLAPRVVSNSAFAPFVAVGGITLVHPAARVERVGFHQSNHDGARTLDPLPTAVAPLVLESRERDTGARTAADVVVDPTGEIRAPVTGVVKRAGTYTLYCDHRDDYLVIAPDANPAWEVKLLHINGVRVRRGQRVTAGVTVVAPGPTVLPFESQVDEVTADPAWPHVHIEVVDPTVKDRPTPGGGC